MTLKITATLAKKVLKTIDAGLVSGLGRPQPGQMCVMAAINYAMGAEHGDKPTCVGSAVRAYDIRLNDAPWSSKAARASGMRREAIAKLGSADIDQREFAEKVTIRIINRLLPLLFEGKLDKKLLDECAKAKTLNEAKKASLAVRSDADAAAYDAADAADAAAYAAAYAADAAAYAAADAAYADKYLILASDIGCEVLVEMGTEGSKFLYLVDEVAS